METAVQMLPNGRGHLAGLFSERRGGERSVSGCPIFRVGLSAFFTPTKTGGSHKKTDETEVGEGGVRGRGSGVR